MSSTSGSELLINAIVGKQSRNRNLQPARQLLHILNRDVPDAPLNVGNIRAMQPGPLCELFLRYAKLTPPLPDGEAKPLFNLWCALVLDANISADMHTMRLQEISDNLILT
jgi:hypothetical protein